MRRLYRWFLAKFRLNLRIVCEESVGLGPHEDYHDYDDDIMGVPSHMIPLICKRCGKEFYI